MTQFDEKNIIKRVGHVHGDCEDFLEKKNDD